MRGANSPRRKGFVQLSRWARYKGESQAKFTRNNRQLPARLQNLYVTLVAAIAICPVDSSFAIKAETSASVMSLRNSAEIVLPSVLTLAGFALPRCSRFSITSLSLSSFTFITGVTFGGTFVTAGVGECAVPFP